jgi:hypothetical protein
MNNLFVAKETGALDNGARYIILQDNNNSFHVTVSHEQKNIYDNFVVQSIEELRSNIYELSKELFGDLTDASASAKLNTVLLLTEQTSTENFYGAE